jgi:hypothetical protein
VSKSGSPALRSTMSAPAAASSFARAATARVAEGSSSRTFSLFRKVMALN